jgi:hypothetical protein
MQNSVSTTVCALPTKLSETYGHFMSGGDVVHLPIQRYNKGDTITYTLKPLDHEYLYTKTFNGHKTVDVDSKEVDSLYSTLIFDYANSTTLKMSDLLYTAPTAKDRISNISNMSLHFYDSKGESYPIFMHDDCSFSLKFTAVSK